MKTFKNTSQENKTFIQAVAKNEVGFYFTIEQLDILLGDETEKFIVNPLNTYTPSAANNIDTYDKGVVATLITEQLTGVPIGGVRNKDIDEIMQEDDWAENLYCRKELHEHFDARKETTKLVSISTGKFPDHVAITTSEQYSDVILNFLIEHKDEIKERLLATEKK